MKYQFDVINETNGKPLYITITDRALAMTIFCLLRNARTYSGSMRIYGLHGMEYFILDYTSIHKYFPRVEESVR